MEKSVAFHVFGEDAVCCMYYHTEGVIYVIQVRIWVCIVV
jgi:hypothetical protein